jgi:hypothetical protein
MIGLSDEFRAVEQDDRDLHTMEQVRTVLQSVPAIRQKEADGMLGGKMTPRAMRRAGSSLGY